VKKDVWDASKQQVRGKKETTINLRQFFKKSTLTINSGASGEKTTLWMQAMHEKKRETTKKEKQQSTSYKFSNQPENCQLPSIAQLREQHRSLW